MVRVRGLETPPPGAGFDTARLAVPALATSAARIAASTWVALTYVVRRGDPFHSTDDCGTNPLPCSVRLKSVIPAETLTGLSEVRPGSGFTPRPLPLRVTVWGEPGALSVMLSSPLRGPAAVGANATSISHLLPEPSWAST